MNICRDCKYFVTGILPQCAKSKPASIFSEWGDKEPVFGTPNHLPCIDCRTYENLCGPTGKWWEKR